MMQQLDPTIAGGGVAGARRGAVRGDVVGDVAVEPLRLPLDEVAGEQELRFPHLLHARAAVRQVDRRACTR